jgi:SAM-dependent methyltransferase
MIRYIGERGKREGWTNVQGIVGLPDDPKLGPASVDRILVVDVWHHIDARGAYAQKLAAALKPGGYLLIVDFTQETEKGPPKEHRLTPEAITADLVSAKLRVSTVPAGLPDQFVIKGERAP